MDRPVVRTAGVVIEQSRSVTRIRTLHVPISVTDLDACGTSDPLEFGKTPQSETSIDRLQAEAASDKQPTRFLRGRIDGDVLLASPLRAATFSKKRVPAVGFLLNGLQNCVRRVSAAVPSVVNRRVPKPSSGLSLYAWATAARASSSGCRRRNPSSILMIGRYPKSRSAAAVL